MALFAAGFPIATMLAKTSAGAAPLLRSELPGISPLPTFPAVGAPEPEKAQAIRSGFLHAWNGYKNLAWGHDEVLPISGGYREFFAEDRPIGLSIIEALDTHYVMGLDDEVALSMDWIEKNLDFDIDAEFHVFEAIIRLVGGLLAGHLTTGSPRMLDLCRDLADRLLPAFTDSPTGMPYSRINLRTGAVSGSAVPLAEIGTNILEFGVLSQLTGDPRYYTAAKNAYRAVIERRSALDLLGTTMNVETGQWPDRKDVAPNPPVDSFYEYLWGGWAMFADVECFTWYWMLISAMRKYQTERVNGLLWFKEVDMNTGEVCDHRQSELAVCILSPGGDIGLAVDYFRSWTAVLDKYGVIPDAIDYTTLTATSRFNNLYPEYANCAFDLYGRTGDSAYRDAAWKYFQHLETYHRIPNGYTVIDDVTTRPMKKGDLFPAYSFAENFKWLYLTFSATDRFDYFNGYISTEGKLLRGSHPRR